MVIQLQIYYHTRQGNHLGSRVSIYNTYCNRPLHIFLGWKVISPSKIFKSVENFEHLKLKINNVARSNFPPTSSIFGTGCCQARRCRNFMNVSSPVNYLNKCTTYYCIYILNIMQYQYAYGNEVRQQCSITMPRYVCVHAPHFVLCIQYYQYIHSYVHLPLTKSDNRQSLLKNPTSSFSKIPKTDFGRAPMKKVEKVLQRCSNSVTRLNSSFTHVFKRWLKWDGREWS